jgi:hypothetical protein
MTPTHLPFFSFPSPPQIICGASKFKCVMKSMLLFQVPSLKITKLEPCANLAHHKHAQLPTFGY